MPECGEGERGRKKGNGAQRCLETFTDMDNLERLPRNRIYPLVRQFLYCCTQSEVKLRVHKQGCNAAKKSVHLESPLLLLGSREPKKLFQLFFPSVSICKIQEHLSSPKSDYHSQLPTDVTLS